MESDYTGFNILIGSRDSSETRSFPSPSFNWFGFVEDWK